ncbi:MAG: ATPase domain-containing protein [Candidatus Bathyarchaeia archaeon]
MEYVPTGLHEFDMIIGGIPKPYCLCLSGDNSANIQPFIFPIIGSFLRKGLRGLYVCLDLPAVEIKAYAEALGYDIKEYEKDYSIFFLDLFELEQKAIIETAKVESLEYSPDDLLRVIGEFMGWIKNGFLVIDSITTIMVNMEAKQAYELMRAIKLLTRSFNIVTIGVMYQVAINNMAFHALKTLSDGLIILEKDRLKIKYMTGTLLSDEIFEVSRDLYGRISIKPILPKEVSRKVGLKISDIFQRCSSISLVPLLTLGSDVNNEIPADELMSILRLLEKEGLLEGQPYCTAVICPYCNSYSSYFFLECPECKSTIIEKGEAIEHFKCGHVDFRNKFEKGDKMVCPKCGKELNKIGVDYRKAGTWYRCHQGHMFAVPLIYFSCIKCNRIYDLDEAKFEIQNIYQLNEEAKEKLDKLREKEQTTIDFCALTANQNMP